MYIYIYIYIHTHTHTHANTFGELSIALDDCMRQQQPLCVVLEVMPEEYLKVSYTSSLRPHTQVA